MNLKKILSVLVAGTMALSAMAFSVSAAELPPYESEVVENRSVTGAQAVTNYLGDPKTNETIDLRNVWKHRTHQTGRLLCMPNLWLQIFRRRSEENDDRRYRRRSRYCKSR